MATLKKFLLLGCVQTTLSTNNVTSKGTCPVKLTISLYMYIYVAALLWKQY